MSSGASDARKNNISQMDELPNPRLLIDVISERARNEPEKIWGAVPLDESDPSKGYEDISYARLVYAVDRGAKWLVETLQDQKTHKFETLAYLGPPDSRYVILVLASIKAGFQLLLLSPRNSDEAQYHVMRQAECVKFLCASSMRQRVETLLRNLPQEASTATDGGIAPEKANLFVVPEQDVLLKNAPEPSYPYNRTLEQARREPLVTLHTSSTTGMPKIIPVNQGWGFHEDLCRHLPKHNGLDIITRKPFDGGVRLFCGLPLFHAGGILLVVLKSLYHDLVSVFQPGAAPMSATLFNGIMIYGKCDGCVIPPSLLEDMIAEPSYFDTLANLKFVQFGSGPLSKAAGDTLLTRQNDCPHYTGSTEMGIPPFLELDDPVSEWQYFRFHPWGGVEMRPVGDDGRLFEFFVKRNSKNIPGLQPVFELFPDIDEWPTRDLFLRHPTKPDLFRSAGRSDDVIVLSNGEKLNPIDTESVVANAVSGVVGALVFGQGRFMPGILLEIRDIDVQDSEQRANLVEQVWPYIAKANLEAPKHGQISKSSILFTSPDKPFARTPKLSLRRGPTLELYTEEISQMYERLEADLEATNDIELPSDVSIASEESARQLIQHLVVQVTGWSQSPEGDADIFMMGMDSLHVMRISRALKLILSRNSASDAQIKAVNTRMLYSHPTINAISHAIYVLANEPSEAVSTQMSDSATREDSIEQMISKYSDFGFDASSFSHNKGSKILLTGSTGSLGTYLLAVYLRDPHVEVVYCLNRASNARSRQIKSLEEQGIFITGTKVEKKLQFLHSDSIAAPYLGLDYKAYQSLLLAGVTHVIHNAWPVNFNLTLVSFESHVAGVRALIDFCALARGPPKPKFFFVSSVSSVTGLQQKPETIPFDASIPSKMGYGESKYASERILNAATISSRGALETGVLRVGQIAGPVGWLDSEYSSNKGRKGIWPLREWLPSLIVSSLAVGAIPDTLGRMNSIEWIPVDALAIIISEITHENDADSKPHGVDNMVNGHALNGEGDAALGAKVYNLVNPKDVAWEAEILPVVQSELNIKTTVSLSKWIELVQNLADDSKEAKPNPAKKIIPFYEALVTGDNASNGSSTNGGANGITIVTDAVSKTSPTFRKLDPVKKEWMKRWIEQWSLRPLKEQV